MTSRHPLRSVRATSVLDGRRAPVDLPVATVRAVVHEAAHETVADHLRWYPDDDGVRYVEAPDPLHCAAGVECVPLAGILDLGVETAGHLHRVGPPSPVADATPAVAALGALVAAKVVRDLLDVRLARAQHDVDRLRIALETCQLQEIEADIRAMGGLSGRRRAAG